MHRCPKPAVMGVPFFRRARYHGPMSQERPAPHEPGFEMTSRAHELRYAVLRRIGPVELLRKTHEFSLRLREKYPDYAERRAYHVLAGTRPRPDARIIEEDFPGDDSVIRFLESLAGEEDR